MNEEKKFTGAQNTKAPRRKKSAFPYQRELIGILVTAATLFLTAAFFTFNINDTSWFHAKSTPSGISNACGIVGAHAAALCIYLFGSSTVIFLALLFFIAYVMLFNRSWKKEWDRVFAFTLLLVANTALSSRYQVDFVPGIPGGALGTLSYGSLKQFFDATGSFIFLIAALWISLLLLIRFSFVGLLHSAGKYVSAFFTRRAWFVHGTPYAHKVWHITTLPFKATANALRTIFNGSYFEEPHHILAEFEYSELSADEVRALVRNTIWDELTYKNTPFSSTTFHEHPTEPNNSIMPARAHEHKKEITSATGEHQSFLLPDVTLFAHTETEQTVKNNEDFETLSHILEEKLQRFGVTGKVVSIKRGPVVTLFEYQPDIDAKLSKIVALEDDLALALQATSIRIIAPIPGKALVGFEVANKNRKNVLLAQSVKSNEFATFQGNIPLIIGEDTLGKNVVIDLSSMPHLLVAGSTGSGKSVCLHAFLMSILTKCSPEEVKIILIDPKRLEFAAYVDIPHLIVPIVTDAARAILALRYVVKEMEERYATMAHANARNIVDYNAAIESGRIIDAEPMPFMVVMIDELADLMMTAGIEIEDLIARTAQMARAAGIHMIVATQRPSVDVITGLIKVNFPSRIAFRVTSKTDSRTILDCGGADKLLGKGDMLFLDAQGSLRRVHGAYVTDQEIIRVTDYLRLQQKATYVDISIATVDPTKQNADAEDYIFNDVLTFLQQVDEVSISLLQRRFRIGYNRSARIIEMLESRGMIMPADGSKTRKVIR